MFKFLPALLFVSIYTFATSAAFGQGCRYWSSFNIIKRQNTVTANAVYNDSSTIHSWSVNGILWAQSNSPRYSHIFRAPGVYRILHQVNVRGCQDSSSQLVSIDSIPVTPCQLDTNFRIRVRGYTASFTPIQQSALVYSAFMVYKADGTPLGNTAGHINLRAGRYLVQHRIVEANSPCFDTSSRRAFVVDSVVPPTCYQLTRYSKALQSNRLNVNITFPDSISRYTWDFGDGGPEVDGISRTHTYQRSGTYRVTLTAQGYLQYCIDTSSVIVFIQLPTPCQGPMGVNSSFNILQQGSRVDVVAAPIDSSFLHSWTFGDTSLTRFGPFASHTYSAPGTYYINHTVMGRGLLCNSVDSVYISPVYLTTLLTGRISINLDSLSPDSVLVECIGVDDTSYQASSGTIRSGYAFTVLSNKQYLLYVTPISGAARSNYLPSYLGNTLNWTPNSMVYASPPARLNLDIDLLAAQFPTASAGQGSAWATVSGNGLRFVNSLAPGVERTYRNSQTRLLVYSNAAQAMGFAMHSSGGQFTFSRGLANGSYTLRPETPLLQSQSQRLTISNGQPAMAQFYVHATGIITTSPTGSKILLNQAGLHLAPNPSQGQVSITIAQTGITRLRITDALGHMQIINAMGKTTFELHPAKGIYTVESLTENGQPAARQRLIVQ